MRRQAIFKGCYYFYLKTHKLSYAVAVWLNSFGAPFSEHTGIFFALPNNCLYVNNYLNHAKISMRPYFIWLFFDYILPSLLYR